MALPTYLQLQILAVVPAVPPRLTLEAIVFEKWSRNVSQQTAQKKCDKKLAGQNCKNIN